MNRQAGGFSSVVYKKAAQMKNWMYPQDTNKKGLFNFVYVAVLRNKLNFTREKTLRTNLTRYL